MPESVTDTRSMRRPSGAWLGTATTETRPAAVNLTALSIRFDRIWPMRAASPTIRGGSSADTSSRTSRPFLRAFAKPGSATVGRPLADVERRLLDHQAAGLDLRDVEDVVDERQQHLGGALRAGHELPLIRRSDRSRPGCW